MMGNRTNKNPDALLPGERVQAVSLDSIRPFRGHPFQVREDAELESLKESIRLNGVISPAVVRPLPDKGYEMISGHRRMAATSAGPPRPPSVGPPARSPGEGLGS